MVTQQSCDLIRGALYNALEKLQVEQVTRSSPLQVYRLNTQDYRGGMNIPCDLHAYQCVSLWVCSIQSLY